MQSVLRSLMEITVYSALIIGAIWVFKRIWAKSLSPAFSYAIWFLLIARLMLPVTLESGFHLESLLPQPQAVVRPFVSDTPEVTAPEVSAPRPITPETGTGALAEAADIAPIGSQAPIAPHIPEAQGMDAAPSEKPQADWKPWVLALWLAGVLAHIGWLALGYARFLQQMRARQCETPLGTQALLDECKRALGIRGRIRLVIIKGLPSPALMGRTVLLPEGMSNARHAILHELTHIKRADQGICLLIAALKCVYWFNPAVRWALNQMLSDMETACDARVMTHMNLEEKRNYLATIIDLFSAEALPLPGMAKGTRDMAQKRIQGAFMPGRTRTSAKAFAFALAALLLVAGFTTACQSTPQISADALPGVQTAAPTTKFSSEPAPEPAASPFPSHYTGSYTQENMSVAPDTALPYAIAAQMTQPNTISGIQHRLEKLGYLDPSDVNGLYDDATWQAVKMFQQENGLKIDGFAGASTMDRLYSNEARPYTARADRVSAFIQLVRSKEGAPYERGAKGPLAYDCDGLVYESLLNSGVKLDYMTADMWAEADYETITDMKDILAGDILCFKGHVGIALGGGQMIDASSSSGKVRITKLETSYWQRNFACAKRVF